MMLVKKAYLGWVSFCGWYAVLLRCWLLVWFRFWVIITWCAWIAHVRKLFCLIWWFCLSMWFCPSFNLKRDVHSWVHCSYLLMQAVNDNDVRNIVLSYLVHNCYKETAESFIGCTGMKQPSDFPVNMDKRKSRWFYLWSSCLLSWTRSMHQFVVELSPCSCKVFDRSFTFFLLWDSYDLISFS